MVIKQVYQHESLWEFYGTGWGNVPPLYGVYYSEDSKAEEWVGVFKFWDVANKFIMGTF